MTSLSYPVCPRDTYIRILENLFLMHVWKKILQVFVLYKLLVLYVNASKSNAYFIVVAVTNRIVKCDITNKIISNLKPKTHI
jgi:hypothetical protein